MAEPGGVADAARGAADAARGPVSTARPGADPAGGAQPSFKAGLAQALGDQFSFEKSVGGKLGIAESVVPLTVFSVVFGITHDVVVSCVAALAPSLGFAVYRLVKRQTLMQAISGVIGLGIGAFFAVRTGKAENFFLPSIIKNAAYGTGYAISALVRWPIIGVLLGFMLGEQLHWRQVPARLRAYTQATWIWVGLFGVRLAVQIPLYLLSMTTALGFASVPLGFPLFALVIWLTWIVVRRVPVAHPPQHHGEHEGHGHHATRQEPAGADPLAPGAVGADPLAVEPPATR